MNRIDWIDNLRGFGIVLVIMGHNPSILSKYIYSFHMPLFFFLSGLLFYKEKYIDFKDYVARKFKTIVVPYFVFSFIFYLYWIFVERNSNFISKGIFESEGQLYSPVSNFFGIFLSAGDNEFMYWGTHMWFLTCLFVIGCIFYFVSKYNWKIITITLLVFLMFGYILGKIKVTYLPWNIDVALVCLLFYGMGYLIRDYIKDINLKKRPILLVFTLVTLSIIYFFCTKINGRVDIRMANYNNFVLFLFASISGILIFTLLFKLLRTNKYLTYIGVNSIIIYIFHLKMMPYAWLVPHLPSLFSDPTNIIRSLFLSSLELIFTIPIIMIVNRYFYYIIGRKKKV